MKLKFLLLSVVGLAACATPNNDVYDETFSRSEIASFSATYFDINEAAAARALKPTYKKYGAPHAYISGHMSSVDDVTLSRLYGSGEVRAKLRLPKHTFWKINGDDLQNHFEPIKTAHLVYETARLEDLPERLTHIGNLTKRGQVFTIFERVVDDQIVITLHRSNDLPERAKLNDLHFFQ
ncbi:MAG: EipA family protein [Maricaulaceae bacterium]